MDGLGLLCLNFLADLAQNESQKQAGGCAGAQRGTAAATTIVCTGFSAV